MKTGALTERLVGWILALLTTIVVIGNQQDVGVARDEVVYMQHGSRYADWWLGFGKADITKTFGGPGATDNNREHPPLIKTLFGLSEKLFHDKLGVNEVTAYRIPTAILHGICVLLVYLMALALWGFAEAVAGALLLLLLPRALFHAGLAAFDAPIMTLWFATIYAYWKCLDGRKWPWHAGVVFGLALATKHNAFLLPFAIGAHYVVLGIRNRAAGWRGIVLHRWRVLASFIVLGPLMLIAVWPWLWFDTYQHVRDWIVFHTTHVHYNFEYLGDNWNAPRFPWHTALVTTLFTVPVVTLVAAALGAVSWFVRRTQVTEPARAPGLLLALSAVASIGPFFLGTTPIFGAEKHWMPALPSICIAAGVGVVWAARLAIGSIQTLRPLPDRARSAILAGVVLLVVSASAVETLTAQPYALTWYNALAGGAAGGADHGMNRQFWGVAARGVLPALAAEAPAAGAPARHVYTHDAAPAWGIYHRVGLIPRSLPDAGWEQGGIDRSKLALVIHEKHFNRHDYLIWKSYGTVQPMFVLRANGVPVVSVYRRR
ncbi:MAG: glycosyltransferase family 39 protein [Deltaproteobacteria bacterium]|nr:glycosyltransferase family 39 protein [Deltaproteobacteria bacterium]